MEQTEVWSVSFGCWEGGYLWGMGGLYNWRSTYVHIECLEGDYDNYLQGIGGRLYPWDFRDRNDM